MSELQWKKRDFLIGDIVVSQVYADRKSEYILNPYNPHKILRA